MLQYSSASKMKKSESVSGNETKKVRCSNNNEASPFTDAFCNPPESTYSAKSVPKQSESSVNVSFDDAFCDERSDILKVNDDVGKNNESTITNSGNVQRMNKDDQQEPNLAIITKKTAPSTSDSKYSYTDTRIDNNNHDFDELDEGLFWTRSRIKATESRITNITAKASSSFLSSYSSMDSSVSTLPSLSLQPSRSSQNTEIKLTKEMLSNACVISQLDAKFIVVNADGVLCLVDQHAADERVGLERLESSILSSIASRAKGCASPGSKGVGDVPNGDNYSDLIKYTPLQPSKKVHLSFSQLSTIQQYGDVLNQWYFNYIIFDTSSSDHTEKKNDVLLVGVPNVCGKIATADDFIQFVSVLGRCTSDAALVRPPFVKRVLASRACRYAIMFGDILPQERCIDLIKSLSQCDMSFICAHGRPSIAPLLDMNGLEGRKSCGKRGTWRQAYLGQHGISSNKRKRETSEMNVSHEQGSPFFRNRVKSSVPLQYQLRYRRK